MSLSLPGALNRHFHVPISCSMPRRQAGVSPLLMSLRRKTSRRLRGLQSPQAMPRNNAFASDAYQEVITILTMDGKVVRVPGNLIKRPQEQKLCIGASFILAATNGHDPARRVNIEGFCQSCDYLFESIEDVVRSQRGEILMEEREMKSGLHEILKLTVAVPFLWGVPPQLETLSDAIASGGGVVHRMSHQWVVSY